MAKQVSEILIKLGLEGVQGLDKLKGAFRELEKSIGPNNAAIERARQSIIDYGRDSRNTEQVIKGQIDALRGLQSQVERGSSTWAQLATDIEQFRQAARRTDSEIETLRQGILSISSGTDQSQASLRAYIVDLGKLRSEASLTGRTFTDLGSDIAALTARLAQAEAQTVQTSRAFGRVLGQALASTSAGARRQLQDLQLLITEQRQAIDTIDTLSQRERRLTHNIEARADAQDRLNRSLAQQRQLTYQESIRSGREGVRAGAAAFADPDFLRTLTPEALNRRLGELPDTTAGLSQGLTELSERLANTTRNSVDYLTVAMQMAGAQRELTAVTRGYAQALLMGIRTGTVAPSARNLQEAATALRAEMAQLDTTTTEGARAYADNAREANSLERRIRALAGAYRTVRDAARSASKETGGINPILPSGARNPAYRAPLSPAQENAYAQPIGPQAFPEAGRRAQQSIQSALDDVNRIYENAKIQRAEIQTRYDNIYAEKLLQGLDLEGQIRDKAFRDELTAFDRQLEARDRKRRGRLTAGQAVQAGGAVISGGIFGGPEGFLGGLGGAAIGSAIPGLGTVGGAFAGAAIGAQVGMFRQQIAGTADYASQIGKLQVALRGIVGSQADYETALRVAASATRELNIPQEVAIGGLTRLTAAVRGAGGTITDSSFAFTAVNEAIKATGGGAQQAEGAILALTQVFSKGKVSAEELNQLAERLPGTFTLFAQAAGKTGPELQKALEQGQVGLNDLTKFLAILRDKYSGTAKTIAQSSEEAGARLQVAFNGMRLSVGKALQPLGAEFQNAFANFIYTITPALTAAVTGIANAISGMYKMIASGFGLLSQLKGLVINVTKALIVFGGVSAGVFVANNITTFTTAIKGTLGVLRTMLSIEKALLVIESARLATQTLIAGLSAGATKGRVVGAVLGGAAGIGAVLGIGEVIKKIVNDVEAGLSGGLGNIKLDVKDLTTFSGPPDKGADKAAKAAEKAAAKERKNLFNELLDQLNARNKVLTQQGRLNEKVAQTESEKAALALLTAEELLRNEQAQLDLRLKYGEVSKQVYTQQQEAIRLEGKVVREEFNKTVKSIKDETDSLVSGITGPGGLAGPTENPLQRASRELTDEIKKRQERAKQLGGPRGEKAFKDLGAIDVNKVASFSVVGQDIVDLTNQVNELERGSKELTILEQLAQKYVQIWDDLDPKLQQQLITLTAQKDALTKQKEAAQELKALYADIGMSIKEGVVGAIQGAIDGTKSLQQVATDLLNSIANRLLDVAVNMALFGVMSGTGTGGGLLGSLFKNAKGNAYAQNGIVPFAMGGIVNKPTLFKFANGGAGNLGLMGEAGPEAIIPLKRGSDGKLGVVASGSEGGGGGGVVSVGEINITVQNTGETLSPGAQKQIAGQVQGIVLATLANERRSGGMLR